MFRTIFYFVCCLLLFNCATIMNGTKQKIVISSSPAAAKILIDNKEQGITPLIAQLSRKDNHIVKIQLEGYQQAELIITKKISKWIWGDIVLGSFFGLAVDAISGGLYVLKPELLNTELQKIIKNDCIFIITVLTVDPNWLKIGQIQKSKQNYR